VEYDLRRAIERALHDGVQQQLIALGVKLQLAQEVAEQGDAAVLALLDELVQDVHTALDDVRRLAWEVYPSLLLDRGVLEALREGLSVRVDANGIGRYSRDIEAAVYFSCVEVLGTRPAGATIRLEDDGRELSFKVEVDGAELEPVPIVAQRIEAVGGRVSFARGSVGAAIPLSRSSQPGT
jgi:signal transduction histidine kinase